MWFHFELDGVLYTCASVWQYLDGTTHAVRFGVRDAPRAFLASSIRTAVIHCRSQDVCMVLVPPPFRQ